MVILFISSTCTVLFFFCHQIQTEDWGHQRSQQSSSGIANKEIRKKNTRITSWIWTFSISKMLSFIRYDKKNFREVVCVVLWFDVWCCFRGVRFGWRTKKPATASFVRKSFPSQDERSVSKYGSARWKSHTVSTGVGNYFRACLLPRSFFPGKNPQGGPRSPRDL